MLRIVVDDIRTFDGEAMHFRSGVAAWEYFVHEARGYIDELWLDHDMGDDDQMNGQPGIYWLLSLLKGMAEATEPEWSIGIIYVHSMNPVGAEYIINYLSPYYNVKRGYLGRFLPA